MVFRIVYLVIGTLYLVFYIVYFVIVTLCFVFHIVYFVIGQCIWLMVNHIVYLVVGDGIFGILYFVFLNGDFDEDTMLGPSYSLTCSC